MSYALTTLHILVSMVRTLHRRRLRSRAILAATLACILTSTSWSAVPTQAAQPRGVRVPLQYFGLHDGSQLSYGRARFGSLRIWDAQVAWEDVETSPGSYDWTHLDSLVAAARAHHVQVTLVLGMTPSFYADTPSAPPADLRHFRAYVRAVMTRYRDFGGQRGIWAYQVWNEGNVPLFWVGSPKELAQVTRIVHEVRDHVDPGATVVAPSFAVRLPGQRRWFSAYQSSRVAGRPVWHFYDANALSLYPKESYAGRPGTPEDAMALLGRIHRRLTVSGVPESKPIWATEINYGLPAGTAGTRAATPIPQTRQVANVLRTYLLGAARGLDRMFWYRYDWGEAPTGGALANTLLSDPDEWARISPAGLALATVERWLRGRLVASYRQPACAHDSLGTYTCVVRHAGGVRRIMWNPRLALEVRVRGADSVDDQYGRPTRLHGAYVYVRVDYRPVMLNWNR
jgi:polysaccharide biosynthesis protein PslG